MTRVRYLAIVHPSGAAADRVDAALRDRFALRRHQLGASCVLWLEQDHEPIGLDDRGVLIGALYHPGSVGPLTTLSAAMRQQISTTGGDHLLRSCWGGYIAIMLDPATDRVALLRAPMGDLPCYLARGSTTVFAASDVALLVAAGAAPPEVDWSAVARHLAATDIRRTETCLRGVTELPGGSRLTFDAGSSTVEARWSPWQSAAPDQQIDDPGEAHRQLRNAIDHCVAMRAAGQEVLLKLSGGLDSSIVAAALANAGARFTCLNLVTPDAIGDERRYARLAARAVDRVLIERQRSIAQVSIVRSAAARLPRPTARSFTQASESVVAEVAAENGATAVFDGGGGDSVFCSLQSVRPVADCLLAAEGRTAFWPTARSVAALAQVSLWTVLRKTWSAYRRPVVVYPWPIDYRLLTPWAKDEAAGAATHPWFEPPPGALPGKAAHVALVAQAQSVAEGFDVEDALPTFSPLLAQPVVEACLRVPSWRWFDGSRNRAAARSAFADVLPAAIAGRASKGSPDGFIATLYDANRPLIRSLLLDGELAGHGVIDSAAVRSLLDDPRPVVGHHHLRIMQLVDVEVWARSWSCGGTISTV